MKSVQIRGYFWSVFFCIQSEYRKIRTTKNSVFGHFSRSVQIKDLNNSLKRLESDVQTVKTANNNLLTQLENTERQCWANAQYSRRECVEVMESKDLEHTVCKVFNSIGFDIGQDRMEACHRLTKSDSTSVKFSRRKDCQHLMRIK